MNRTLLFLPLIAILSACAAVDYSGGRMKEYDSATSYYVEEVPNGLKIAVKTSRYQFFPIPSQVGEEGISAIRFIAKEEALKRGKTCKKIEAEDVKFSTGRNGITGITTWSGIAIAEYVK